MGIFNSCDKCLTVKGLRLEIQYLEKELSRIKEHYKKDINTLNRQIALEREEYKRHDFIIEDNNIGRDIGSLYEFETITTYKPRGSKRTTYYQNYFE